MKSLSSVQLFATPWTAAYQAPPSMGFSRQEYWSAVPLPSLFIYAHMYEYNFNHVVETMIIHLTHKANFANLRNLN